MATLLQLCQPFDHAVMAAIQQLSSTVMDKIMLAFTFFGEETFAILLLIAVYWCWDKRIGEYLLFSLYVAMSFNGLLKDVICRPRPFLNDQYSDLRYVSVKGLLVDTEHLSSSWSFPSGHSQTAGSIYGSLINGRKPWIKVCGIVLILLVSGIVRIPGFLNYEVMPDILGLSQQDAIDILKEENFDTELIVFKYDVSDEYNKGEVISSSYKTGDIVKNNKKFTITLSKGPSFLVEDYTGLYITDVLNEFEKEGVQLNIKIEYEGKKDTNPGIILQQKDLKVGQRIDPDANETITFIVCEYPTIKISKDYIGKDVQQVKEELNELGIAVVIKPAVSNPVYYTVVQIDPDVGSTYTQEGTDSVVTLYYD